MSDEWYTPDDLFRTLSDLYGPFTMDVCATPDSARAPRFFTLADDGLAQLWEGVCWCAPPYSNPLPWVQKAIESTTGYRQDEWRDHNGWGYTGAAERVVMLVKNDPSTTWYGLGAMYATDHVALPVRVRFTPGAGQRASTPNFASSILVFGRVERTWADYNAPTLANFFAQPREEDS
jgi:site-specific DNA-methyltransferase (adenine-specific)